MSDIAPNLSNNSNILQTTKFRMVFTRLPNVEYHLTDVILPGITVGVATQQTPHRDRPIPGNKVEWEPLEIAFNVSESIMNWKEIHDWIRAIGKPTDYTEYRRVSDAMSRPINVYSDATLVILSSHNNANVRVNFKDLWPSGISSMRFATGGSAMSTIQCTVSFQYLYYDIELID